MSKKIITISREFGSGGRFIGEEVAKQLGIAYYDKDIIAKVAKESGLAKEFIEQKGELAPTKSIFAYSFVGRTASGISVEDYLYQIQREVIESLADKGPCVIIGRNADSILKDREDCLNVFIYGDEADKMKRIGKLYSKNDDEAKKLLGDVDKKRAVHYKYHTDREWGKAQNYSICLNSSVLGYDKCMEFIKELYL